MLTTTNRRGAFTLIELLVVIAVIAVLITIAIPAYTGVQERARVTQDMSNLRQIGLATQMYLNDNDGAIFDTATPWMKLLHPKYLGAWKIFQSPFDGRSPSENDTSAPISYGLNGHNVAGMLANKITDSGAFIIFAPAQDSGSVVKFSGNPAASVTVYKETTSSGTAEGGTHNKRNRINAVFADWHSETMPWTTFKNDTPSASDPSAGHRWDP